MVKTEVPRGQKVNFDQKVFFDNSVFDLKNIVTILVASSRQRASKHV